MNKEYYLKVKGRVVSGNKKGQKIGFPTINLNFKGEISGGVYAGIVKFDNQEYKAGVVYFADKNILEAHLLDFSGDLYGKEIEVEVGIKVRDIIKFESEEELVRQIKQDLEIIKGN